MPALMRRDLGGPSLKARGNVRVGLKMHADNPSDAVRLRARPGFRIG